MSGKHIMNKIERVTAVLEGRQPDMIPAGFWYHYDPEYTTKQTAQAHLKTFRETGVDVYKIMQDYLQHIDASISTPNDWDKVRYPGRESAVYQKLLDVLKMILDGTGHDALTFQTMFGPLKTVVQTYGYDMVMEHSRTCPEKLAQAVKRVAEAQAEWAQGFIENGADGIFFAGQFSEPERYTDEEFVKLVTEPEMIMLSAAEKAGGKNILHICGEPDYEYHSTPSRYADYPGAIVNWSVKDTGLSLKDGKKLFGGRPILGGMNNRGNILKGTDEEIKAEVNLMIASAGTTAGYMLGADCTIQGEDIRNEKIRIAVETAHAYPIK